MESRHYQLRADTHFDFINLLPLSTPCFVFSFFTGSVVMSVVLLIFGFVFVVPLGLLLVFLNQPEVFVSNDTIKVAPKRGLFDGWTFPAGSVKWKVTEDRQVILYPFSLYTFWRALGMKPFRIRLKLPSADLDLWSAALRGRPGQVSQPAGVTGVQQ